MSSVKFEVDQAQSEKLEELIRQLPNKAEEIINKYFEDKGAKNAIHSIIEFVPVSSRNKKHAKNSNPFKETFFNLGFEIETKGGAANKPNSFGYLAFPNDGRGKRNKVAQKFMQQGILKESDVIIDDLAELLTAKLMS